MPAPAFGTFDAPPSWRRIDIISDLHLCAAMPRTFDAFATHLRATPADAVLILGDLFELWVGDDLRARPFEQRCVGVIAAAAAQRTIGFMPGNRDFLVGDALRRDARLAPLADPTLLAAWGRRVVLSHGDVLCLADRPYQAFRAEVRSPAWQAAFLARPLDERLAIAAAIRDESAHGQARRRFDGEPWADVDAAAAVQWLQSAGATALVHGHTHRPGSDELAPGFECHVLSDWDLDHADRAEVLTLTRDGFARVPPS